MWWKEEVLLKLFSELQGILFSRNKIQIIGFVKTLFSAFHTYFLRFFFYRISMLKKENYILTDRKKSYVTAKIWSLINGWEKFKINFNGNHCKICLNGDLWFIILWMKYEWLFKYDLLPLAAGFCAGGVVFDLCIFFFTETVLFLKAPLLPWAADCLVRVIFPLNKYNTKN